MKTPMMYQNKYFTAKRNKTFSSFFSMAEGCRHPGPFSDKTCCHQQISKTSLFLYAYKFFKIYNHFSAMYTKAFYRFCLYFTVSHK